MTMDESSGQTAHIDATGVGIASSRWVVHLKFARQASVGAEIHTTTVADVAMSWALAKAFHQVLGRAIAKYEDDEGEIQLPQSFLSLREDAHE
ncbi:hypothetical protein JYT28_01085 [Desulfobulbus sp. AH-315-M07]|nr:hypothetical protein [Desulfobulbus sp. AH-315-M07]